MKKSFLFFVLILLVSSCEKKHKDYNYLTYIIVGQKDGIGIKYTDVLPNYTIEINDFPYNLKEIKSLDLNDDNIDDFDLIYEKSDPFIMGITSEKLVIQPLGSNLVGISNNNWAEPLLINDTISSYNNWSRTTALIFSYTKYWVDGHTDVEGYWLNDDNIYIGVQIALNENQLFGWIDIDRNIIKQYGVTVPY